MEIGDFKVEHCNAQRLVDFNEMRSAQQDSLAARFAILDSLSVCLVSICFFWKLFENSKLFVTRANVRSVT